jgi:Cysteine dioxygenase type I
VTTVDVSIDHLAVARDLAATPDRWPVAPRFNPAERWYHRLAVQDRYEVWLLTWLPGQGTDLHDHGGSAGAFHVFDGTLTEDTLTEDTLIDDTVIDGTVNEGTVAGDRAGARLSAREFGAGAGRRFGGRHVHRIANRSTRPAVSIHVYGPALTTMTRYRISAGGLTVVSIEHAGVQW